jgi:hypothetical protein
LGDLKQDAWRKMEKFRPDRENENEGIFKTGGNKEHMEIGRLLFEENLDINCGLKLLCNTKEEVCQGFAREIKEKNIDFLRYYCF